MSELRLSFDTNSLTDPRQVIQIPNNLDVPLNEKGLIRLGALSREFYPNVENDNEIDLRSKDAHFVKGALIYALYFNGENRDEVNNLLWDESIDIVELIERLAKSDPKVLERMLHYLYSREDSWLPFQEWDASFDESNRIQIGKILNRIYLSLANAATYSEEEVSVENKRSSVDAAIENSNLSPEIQASLKSLSILTSPYSEQSFEDDEDREALITATQAEFYSIIENITTGLGDKFTRSLTSLKHGINAARVLAFNRDITIGEINVLLEGLLPRNTSTQVKTLAAKQILLIQSMDDDDFQVIGRLLNILFQNIDSIINGRMAPMDIIKGLDHLEKGSKFYKVVFTFIEAYFEILAQSLFTSDTYKEIQLTIRKALYYMEDGETEREQTIVSLTGDIGGGKSNISKYGKVGLKQHGSGTDHISGSRNSVDHVQFAGVADQWLPLRDAGFGINPLMNIFFEIGLLGYRKYYDEHDMEDTALLLDGYPRNLPQLEFFMTGDEAIDSKHNLAFLQIDGDFKNPTDELKEFVMKRVVISRTFDGLDEKGVFIKNSRKDQFNEILIGESTEAGIVGDTTLQAIVEKLLLEVITEQYSGERPLFDDWKQKIAIVEEVYRRLMVVLNGLSNIKFNIASGRMQSYRSAMDDLEAQIIKTNSPVKLHKIIVNQQTKPKEVQFDFADKTIGLPWYNKLNPSEG